MTSRDHAKGVWVDPLSVLYGAAEGIDLDAPCPGGLVRWLRTATGGWVGVVSMIVPMTDGSTVKYADQLVPASTLRVR